MESYRIHSNPVKLGKRFFFVGFSLGPADSVWTEVTHDREDWIDWEQCLDQDLNCSKPVQYNASKRQMLALIRQSNHCFQDLKFQVSGSFIRRTKTSLDGTQFLLAVTTQFYCSDESVTPTQELFWSDRHGKKQPFLELCPEPGNRGTFLYLSLHTFTIF